jgi:hypothetical protein
MPSAANSVTAKRVDQGRLAVHVREIEKSSPPRIEDAVQAGGNRFLGKHQGHAVGGKSLGTIAEEVARELVEDNDLGQPTIGRSGTPAPVVQLAAHRCGMQRAETCLDQTVENVRFRPPLRRARLLEPEVKNVRRRHRNALSVAPQTADIGKLSRIIVRRPGRAAVSPHPA